MKNLLLLLPLFFSLSNTLKSQSDTVFIKYDIDPFSEVISYKTDTVLFDSPFKSKIIYGTMVLPNTYNQIIAKSFGLSLDSVSIKECERNDFEPPTDDKILTIKESKDSLIVEILYVGNCCHSFLCDVQILNEKTINLINHGYGTYCACICGYYITYYFSRFDFESYSMLEEIIIDNNPKTAKQLK